jgi:uncharacterized membrane protein
MRVMRQSHVAIGTLLITLAVPAMFDAQLTSALWALEGAGVLWLGLQFDRRFSRLLGTALQFGAAAALLLTWPELEDEPALWNGEFLGSVTLAAAGLACAYFLHRCRARHRSYPVISAALLGWGLLWWFFAGINEIGRFIAVEQRDGVLLSYFAFTFALMEAAGRRLEWRALRRPGFVLLGLIALSTLSEALSASHIVHHSMLAGLPLAFAVHYWTLARQERDRVFDLIVTRHLLAYWLAGFVCATELAWQAHEWAPEQSLWPLLAWGVGAVTFTQLAMFGVARGLWPFAARPASYLEVGLLPFIIFMLGWSVYANFAHSGAWALAYIPLLNPLDMTHLLLLASLLQWSGAVTVRSADPGHAIAGLIRPSAFALAFLWVSAAVMRTVHHWAGVPFDAHSMFQSVTLQGSLSLVWTVIALALMVYATRSGRRQLWFTGFGLLGVVGAKLLLVDLSNAGTVWWTGSLIGVALLVIAAGYFAPAPPKRGNASKRDWKRGAVAGGAAES